jgi:hypothetical protein
MSRARALLLGFLAAAACANPPPPEETTAPPGATYTGDETCITCHDDAATSLAKTIHARALAGESRPESERGCEACHGPGSVHAEEGGGKGVGGLREFVRAHRGLSRACLACRGRDRLQVPRGVTRSRRCVRCGGTTRALLAATLPALTTAAIGRKHVALWRQGP